MDPKHCPPEKFSSKTLYKASPKKCGVFKIKSLVPRLFKVASKKKCLINECSKRLGELL